MIFWVTCLQLDHLHMGHTTATWKALKISQLIQFSQHSMQTIMYYIHNPQYTK